MELFAPSVAYTIDRKGSDLLHSETFFRFPFAFPSDFFDLHGECRGGFDTQVYEIARV